MIHRGKTNDWPRYAKKTISRFFDKLTDFGVYIGQSRNAKCKVDKNEIVNVYNLIIIYCITYDVFIVWHTGIHRSLHAGEEVTFSISTIRIGELNRQTVEFLDRTLNGTNNQEQTKERVAIIPKDKLFDFLEYFDKYYLMFIPDNCPHEIRQEFDRKIDIVKRYRRDPDFRERILRRYNNTCVVCGTTNEVVLEAAHIIAVEDGGNDANENGVCLCANHHKMYDAGLIDIDLNNETFRYDDNKCKNESWYIEARKRNFRLFITNEN